MPPRPFPYPLRVGVHICTYGRVRGILEKRGGVYSFVRDLLTPREEMEFWLRFCGRSLRPRPRPRSSVVLQHLSGSWAAKEAVIKAAGPRALTNMDVEIVRQDASPYALIRDVTCKHSPLFLDYAKATQGEQPPDTEQDLSEYNRRFEGLEPWLQTDTVLLSSRLEQLESLVEEDPPGQMARLSISHDGEYATAVCLAVESPDPRDVGGEAAAREDWL